MNERFSLQNQIRPLSTKYTGTGNADTTKWEYGTNLGERSLANSCSRYSRMMYFSAVENESRLQIKEQNARDMD